MSVKHSDEQSAILAASRPTFSSNAAKAEKANGYAQQGRRREA